MITFDQADALNTYGKAYFDQGHRPDAAAVERARAGMIAKLMKDPILLRFVREHKAGSPVTQPWQVAGEQRAFALNLLYEPTRFQGLAKIASAFSGSSVEMVGVSIAANILMAIPVFWPNDMRMTAIQAGLPRHTVDREVLPLPLMWWTFETGLNLAGFPSDDGRIIPSDIDMMIDAFLVQHATDGFNIWQFGSSAGEPLIVGGFQAYGAIYPDDLPPQAGGFLGMLSFMNSPYVSSEDVQLTRAERRSVLHQHPTYDLPKVKVIRLRNAESQPRERIGQPEHSDHDHRWLVRGHHRAQWYPSKQSHKVIWIAPYIKGPADKEFKPPMYAVVR